MHKLFTPATGMLDRLRYPQKFALISLIFVLPLALVLVLLMSELNARVAFSEKEIIGNSYLRPLRSLMEHVPATQALVIQAAQGDAAARAALATAQAQVNADFAALAGLEQRFGATLDTTVRYNDLKAVWEQLQQEQGGLSIVASQPRYEQFMSSLRELREHVGDTSNLVLDPDLETYYLMNGILQSLPEDQRLLSQLVLESEQLGAGAGTEYQRAHLFELVTLLGANNEAAQRGLQTALAKSTAQNLQPTFGPLIERMAETTDDFVSVTRSVIGGDAARRSAQRTSGQAALKANFELWERASDHVEALIQQRVDGYVRKLYGVGVFAAIALATVLYLLIGFYRSVMGTVSQLEQTAQRLVNGESADAVALNSRDELGQVAGAFNRVATALIESGAQRRAIVEHAVDGILTLNEQGQITSFNPAAEHMFGYAAAEALGAGVERLMPEYMAIVQNDAPQQETTGQRRDGTTFSMDVTLGKTGLGQQRYTVVIVRDITERKQAEAERSRLHETIIRGQAAALEQLATPLIPVTEHTVVMPLIGSIDSTRASQIVAALLRGVEAQQARVAILDITGVPLVDTQVARTLLQAAQAVELLGARALLTGLRPEVAATLVTLGVDLHGLVTCSTLQSGIAYALAQEADRPHHRRPA